jgi:proline dehydrogenase
MNEFNNVAELQTQTVEVISKEMVENLRNNRSVATGTLARSIKRMIQLVRIMT